MTVTIQLVITERDDEMDSVLHYMLHEFYEDVFVRVYPKIRH